MLVSEFQTYQTVPILMAQRLINSSDSGNTSHT
jgi:hypothetical protein